MQTVSNSYSIQAYARIQNNASSASGKTSTTSPNSHASSSDTNDTISLSPEGKQISSKSTSADTPKENDSAVNIKEKDSGQQQLTSEEHSKLAELKTRDTEVRTHEQAHLSAAGQYATSSASFSYTNGPDGKHYATGGEVSIDMSNENSPEATAQKMRTIQRAALAPANPSATDRNVASQAAAKEAQALQEIRENSSVNLIHNSSANEATGPISKTPDTAFSPRTEASKTDQPPATASDFSRKTMNAAYQAMAALAS